MANEQPGECEALLEQAHLAILRHQLPQARRLLSAVLLADPGHSEAAQMLVQLDGDVATGADPVWQPAQPPGNGTTGDPRGRGQRLWKGIGIALAICVGIKIFAILWINDSLCDAARHGDYRGVKAWLARGASANSFEVSTGDTALADAAASGSRRSVALLLSRGANVNASGGRGSTALVDAAAGGHPDIVSDLLAAGADVDAEDGRGKTALMWATQNGNVQSATLLIAHHANVHLTDIYGRTALGEAQRSGAGDSFAVIQLLRQAGAKR